MGSALLGVSTQNLTSGDVAKVTITISGPNISPDIVQNLVKAGNQWKGTIGQIPAGASRTFKAEAFDASDNLIYDATVSDVQITAGQKQVVTLLLQQKVPPTPFQNTTPTVSALTATSAQVGNEKEIQLVAAAADVDSGDTLTYTWSATSGSFPSGNTGASVTWKSAAAPFTGNATLTVKVSDGRGGETGTTFIAEVQPYFETGRAKTVVTFNTWPTVTNLTSSVDPVDLGNTTSLDVAASDADGDSLTYAWEALGTTCATGSFDNAAAKSPVWTAPATAPAGDTCSLKVTVSDGQGGQTTGTLVVNIGAPVSANLPPQLSTTFQSDDTGAVGDTLIFRVVAADPENTALTFAWTLNGSPISTGITTSSSAPYTSELALTLASTNQATVVVKVTDADSQETTHTFEVNRPYTVSTFLSGISLPTHITYDSAGNLIVGSPHISGQPTLNQILKISTSGTTLATYTVPYTSVVATDRTNNLIYASGGASASDSLYKIDAGGTVSVLVSGVFGNVMALAVASNGDVYLADGPSHVIYKVTPAGSYSIFAGQSGNAGTTDGATPTSSLFNKPEGLIFDANEQHLYVADQGNSRIRKINMATGAVTTLAGSTQGFLNGTGAGAQFSVPRGLAFLPNGDLLVGDGFNHMIRKVTPAGVVTTFAGIIAGGTPINGPASTARFQQPWWLTLHPSGVLYVSDYLNNTIRAISP